MDSLSVRSELRRKQSKMDISFPVEANDTICLYCGQDDSQLRCSACKSFYCSEQCQINDWSRHRSRCKILGIYFKHYGQFSRYICTDALILPVAADYVRFFFGLSGHLKKNQRRKLISSSRTLIPRKLKEKTTTTRELKKTIRKRPKLKKNYSMKSTPN